MKFMYTVLHSLTAIYETFKPKENLNFAISNVFLEMKNISSSDSVDQSPDCPLRAV